MAGTGFGAKDRIPQQDVRTRRTFGNLAIKLDEPSGLIISFAGIKALVQDVITIDASGIKLVFAGGLYSDSGTLKVNHDETINFVANEHINHTAVTLTAGVGLTGGGDISVSRTFDLDISELTADASPTGTDYIVTYDTETSTHKKVLLSSLSGAVETDPVAMAYLDQSVKTTASPTFAGVTLDQVNTPLTTDTLVIQPDTTGGGVGASFFQNVASGSVPKVYLYGFCTFVPWGAEQKYLSIFLDAYGRTTFSGTTTGVMFARPFYLAGDIGGTDRSRFLMPSTGRYEFAYADATGQTYKEMRLVLGSATDGYKDNSILIICKSTAFNFGHGASYLSDPHLILHSGVNSTTQYLEWYHDQTDAHFNVGAGKLIYNDGLYFELGTVTGSQFGTAADQKLAFYGATPVVQRTKATHNNWASLSDVVNALVELGFLDTA